MLELEGIYAKYGAARVLENISLKVNDGEIVALVGSNGAGKTSMVKVIMGLLTPVQGKTILNGVDISKVPSYQRVDLGIGCVPEGRHLFSKMSIEDNLMVGGVNKKAKPHRPQNLEKVYTMFPRLKERRTQSAKTLSGGEQQMLAIGRALMAEPTMLIFDEPSLGLSPKLVGEVLQTIYRLNKENALTVLLIEQDVAESLAISDRGYVLQNGQIVLSDTAKNLLQNEQVKAAYMGM